MESLKNKNTRERIIKAISIFCGVLGIFFYYVHRFVFVSFGNVTVEHILWHLLHSHSGTDKLMLWKGLYYFWWFLFFSVLWVLLVVFYKQVSQTLLLVYTNPSYCIAKIKGWIVSILQKSGKIYAFLCKHILWGILCVSLICIGISCYNINKHFHVWDYIYKNYLKADCKFIEKNSYFPSMDEVRFDSVKRNLVIILGESFEETFNEPDVKGCPLLWNCAVEAGKGQSMPNMYSPLDCGWTISAFTAWHFGLPLKTPLGRRKNDYISKKGFFPHATSIFDILHHEGYVTEFITGSSATFSGKDILFKHGNFRILDKEYWEEKGWSLKEYGGTGWGYNDEFIMQRALEEYVKLQSESKPFVLLVESVDTHFPNGYCPPKQRKYKDIRDAYIYVDRLISSFVQNINEDKNTIVALVGDHLIMGDQYYKWIPLNKRIDRKKRRLFNAFWGDLPKFETEKKKVVAPYDIAPTLLEAAGARWKTRRYGLGVSFFSPEPSLIDSIGIDEMYEQISQNSKFYNSLY